MTSTWAIGIDMGGTFIDLVACSSSGQVLADKHPRVAGALAKPVLEAIDALCRRHGIAASNVVRIVHGSTVVTNLLLERSEPPVAVIANTGLKDVLVLARQDRRELYEPVVAPPTDEARLFPSHLRFEIDGRLNAQGRQTRPLDLSAVDEIAARLQANGVQAVAVGLVFSHRDGTHERAVKEALLERIPGLHVSVSSEVDPRPREFERFLTTAMDAYAKPRVAAYLAELAAGLVERGLPEPLLMRSEGGTGDWRAASACPIKLAMSGPCAALHGIAAHLLGPSLVTLDVGGTSTDIGTIEQGEVAFGDQLAIGDTTLRMRCADVDSIAIGGGSLARVLAGRALRLGPTSQGAWPGPAAYGFGGQRATLTDALCVLGRLPAQLAGSVSLDATAAAKAVSRDVATPLGLTIEEAAQLIVETAATAMAEAVKMRSFQRGDDPADSTLVAAGGGGAQHVAEVAALTGMRRVIVLPHAGVMAALGMLWAKPSCTLERPLDERLDADTLARWSALHAAQEHARAGERVSHELSLLREGQGSAIDVAWSPGSDDVTSLIARFEERHVRLRGGPPQPGATRAVLSRTTIDGDIAGPLPAKPRDGGTWGELALTGLGPRLIAAPTTTVWVPLGWSWTRRADGSLLLEPTS